MTELVSIAERYGLWVVIVLFVLYKGVPAFIERFWPDWIAAQREAQKLKAESSVASLAELARLYERLIAMVEANTKVNSGVAANMSIIERALDANTQQIARLTDVVRIGPKCPLPGCPFMKGDKDTQINDE